MIKKYGIDLVFLLTFVVSVPWLVIETPKRDGPAATGPIAASQGPKAETVATPRSEKGYGRIKARNLFSPDGSYPLAQGLGPSTSPNESYRLVGVLGTGQKKAVLMKSTGEVVFLNEGDKFEDGFVITRIDPLTVGLKKGAKKKELRIFQLEPETTSDRPTIERRSP